MVTISYQQLLKKSHLLEQEFIDEGTFMFGPLNVSETLSDEPSKQDKQEAKDLKKVCSCHGLVLPATGECDW